MNSALYDSIIALILSSLLLIITLLVNPVILFEDSLAKLKKVEELEEGIKDLFEQGYFGKLANSLNSRRSPEEFKAHLKEIFERLSSRGVVGLRVLVHGKTVYTYGSTERAWTLKIIIPSSRDMYVLEIFIRGDSYDS